MDDEYEIIPTSPLRNLEKRINKMEKPAWTQARIRIGKSENFHILRGSAAGIKQIMYLLAAALSFSGNKDTNIFGFSISADCLL